MLGMTGLRGLLWVVVIGEGGSRGKIDRALDARCNLVAILVADMDRTEEGLTDRAGMFEPVLAVDVAHAVALGAGIIFVQHRAPPFDHPAFHVDRNRSRRMDG